MYVFPALLCLTSAVLAGNTTDVDSNKPTVAILDSGIDPDRNFLVGSNEIPEKTVSFVSSNPADQPGGHHGSLMNDVVTGSRYQLKMYDVRVLPKGNKSGHSADILAGLEWLLKKSTPNPDVVLLPFTARYASADNTMMQHALRKLANRDTVLVTGAGDNGHKITGVFGGVTVPAAFPETYTVSGYYVRTDTFPVPHDGKEYYILENSNWGGSIDASEYAVVLDNGDELRGSGIAAAYAAGSAAHLIQEAYEKQRQFSARQVMWELQQRAREGKVDPWEGINGFYHDEPLLDVTEIKDLQFEEVPEDFHPFHDLGSNPNQPDGRYKPIAPKFDE